MPAPPFWSPAVLQRDLRLLGHEAGPESVAAAGAERIETLRYLAHIVDSERAPPASAPPASVYLFWASLGLHPFDAASAGAHQTRVRRHAAAYLRAAIDLAFAARSAEYSCVPEFLPEDAPADATRVALIENLYTIFPGAAPSYPEPKFKPKKRRPNLNSQPQMQDTRDSPHNPGTASAAERPREPLAVLRIFSEANSAAVDDMRARGLTVPSGEGPQDGQMDTCLDAGTDADAETCISSANASSAHAALLSICHLAEGDNRESESRFATESEIDELTAACLAAAEAADDYRTLASDALSLSAGSAVIPSSRDLQAESVLEAELPLAREAHAVNKTVVDRVNRIRRSYSKIALAASQPDASRARASLSRCTVTAERTEKYAIALEKNLTLTDSIAKTPRAPRVPTREA